MDFDDRILPFLEVLRRTQYMARAELAAYQDRLLERLVRHAVATTPFYRETVRLAPVLKGDVFDRSGWADIPIIKRAEAPAIGERLYSEAPPEEAGDYVETQTAGSTRTPMRQRGSALTGIASQALQFRQYEDFSLAKMVRDVAVTQPMSASLHNQLPRTTGW